MRNATCLTLALLALGAVPAFSAPQEGGVSREQQALSDEQSLIVRKLARLRASMDRLAERYEAEGRSHAARLLREALVHLDERQKARASKTLDELMSEAESGLTAGQVVQAIEDQKAIVADLERLLSILMDRPDLDQLQNELEKLKQFTKALRGLSQEEQELRDQIEKLKQASKNAAQKSLEQSLSQLSQQQAELLRENEREARDSGALQLEALEARLTELLEDQTTDVAVAESWRPETHRELSELLAPLEASRTDSARAARLQAAAERARQLSQAAAPGADPEALQRALTEAEAAAEREERHARAGNDPAAAEAAEALRAAAAAAREGKTDELEQTAAALEQSAAEHRAAADEARAAAASEAQSLEEASPELQAALEKAAEQGDAASTAEALAALRRELNEQRFLGQALAASQKKNAERAEQLAESLERAELKDGDTEAAAEALERAKEAMESASQMAAENAASDSAEAAQTGREALEAALQALAKGRESRAQSSAGELAERQQQLAEQTAGLEQSASEASLSPEAKQAVQEQLDAASEAMQEASEALQSGQRSEAASKQREAMEALDEAARESDAGTQPQDQAAREQAEQLAKAQKEVEKRLYEFRKAYEESNRETPLPSLESAEQSARQSGEELQQGDLESAEEKAKDAQREIEEALDQLDEEERQYQRLRDEELLFQIAEEVVGMIETHAQLTADTIEVDQSRTPGERATRAQKLRLRKISRAVQALADRSSELRTAIAEEGSTVFAELFQRIEDDLVRIARSTGEIGGYQSGAAVQARFDDVERDLRWLLESLEEEKNRREQEDSQGGEQPSGPQEEPENRLVPDSAELKLLSRMEGEVLDSLDELLVLYPELAEGGEIDPLLREEISRLAQRHRRTSELFSTFRERLGLPDPEADSGAQ
jgi:hypothetical protein